MSLKDIEEILQNGNIDKLLIFLQSQETKILNELNRIKDMYDEVKWYTRYFNYLNHHQINSLPHVTHFEKRIILYTNCSPDESIEDIEVRLAELKNQDGLNPTYFRRQYGYFVKYESLLSKQWNPFKYFIYCKNKIDHIDPSCLFEIPEGDYLCFSFR